MPLTTMPTFGSLLKQLRTQAGMTQRDLAAALGYSKSLICSLENAQRQPDIKAVSEQFVAALGLQDDPQTAAVLIEQAVLARSKPSSTTITFQQTTQLSIQTELRQAQLAERTETLPALPTALIGRRTEVNQLCNRLLGHSGRLLTLIGPPGIGKTTLALAVAERLPLHYRDGIVFVSLAAVSDPTVMATAILTAVGSSPSDAKPPQNRLIEFLRRKTMLLVLDNLEQITEAAPLVAALIGECPKLCVLATSRERLHLRAEQRYKVPPLDLAPAVELFVQRAQAVAAEFALTPHNQPTLEAICQRLDCLPLAIELCAAQIDLLAPTQLLARVQDRRLDVLVAGARDLPARQRTLRMAIGHSYGLLNDAERSLLRALSVFAGGFTLEAAATIATNRLETTSVDAILHALISKSLVRAETTATGTQRFLLLETIREFALEQLRAAGEEALLRQQHYAIYLQLFRTGDSHMRGPQAATWVVPLEAELDNLRSALQWAFDRAHYADATWMMMATCWFWEHRGFYEEAYHWFAQLLPQRHHLPTDLRLAIMVWYNPFANKLHASHHIEHFWDELLALQENTDIAALRAAFWVFYSTQAANANTAAHALEKAVAYARAASAAPAIAPEYCFYTDCDCILGKTLQIYAGSLIDRGDVTTAASVARESNDLFQSRGNRFERYGGLSTLGRLAFFAGDMVEARRYFLEAVQIVTTAQELEALHVLQPQLGLVILYGGDVAEARQLLNECLQLCLRLKSFLVAAQVCAYLAEAALWQGELDEAAQWLAQSFAYGAQPTRITFEEVQRCWVAARLATAQQQYQRAATLFGLAEQAHSQIHYVIGGPLRALADTALATLQAALEPAAFAEAFAAGQQMPLAEAFATLLPPIAGEKNTG